MKEVGLTQFKFFSNGLRCNAINMYNHMLTMNMITCMINFHGKVVVNIEIIPGMLNRVYIHEYGNTDDKTFWFDCDTVEQATGLQDFITQYNDNWCPDPDTEEPV